jgi:hypothetical protein
MVIIDGKTVMANRNSRHGYELPLEEAQASGGGQATDWDLGMPTMPSIAIRSSEDIDGTPPVNQPKVKWDSPA